MEVIGAGWGRTGTLSLKEALEILGLPCYHMVETHNPNNKGHDALWIQACEGTLSDFDLLLLNYKATVDWPGATFYKQLMERYPHAKVILTVRDPAAWYKSASASIWSVRQMVANAPWYVKALALSRYSSHMQMVNSVVWDGELQGCFGQDPEKAKQMFLEHTEEVKRVVPGDRLLVFEVSQGWGPLCDFLGRPVPQQPFPHVNDAEEWSKRNAMVKRLIDTYTYGVPALAAAVVAGGVMAVRYLQRR